MPGLFEFQQSRNVIFYVTTFVLTFFSYAWLHAARKAFSNAKTTMSEEWTPTNSTMPVEPANIWGGPYLFKTPDAAENFLGTLDFLFMASYACGLFVSGPLGDRVGPGWILIIGMTCTGITIILFGFLKTLGAYSVVPYCVLWVANGFFQSFGWPNTVAIMNNWFGKSRRGLIFGFWSSCASVGNIIGAVLVAEFLQYGYQYAFLVVSSILIAGGVICLVGLVSHPRQIGLFENEEAPLLRSSDEEDNINYSQIQPSEGDSDEEAAEEHHHVQKSSSSVGCCSVFRLYWKSFWQLKVILYSLSYFCLKLVNYSLFFWLPFYLSHMFSWKEDKADLISIWYDIGGIAGGVILGYISDHTKHRALVLFPSLLLGALALFAYYFIPSVSILVVNIVVMTINGFLIGGVACIISAAVCADLGKSIDGHTSDTGTITGIIDGFGSVGAALGQLAVPHLQIALGWSAVFYFFVIMTLLTALSILHMFIQEVRLVIGSRCGSRTVSRTVVVNEHVE